MAHMAKGAGVCCPIEQVNLLMTVSVGFAMQKTASVDCNKKKILLDPVFVQSNW